MNKKIKHYEPAQHYVKLSKEKLEYRGRMFSYYRYDNTNRIILVDIDGNIRMRELKK